MAFWDETAGQMSSNFRFKGLVRCGCKRGEALGVHVVWIPNSLWFNVKKSGWKLIERQVTDTLVSGFKHKHCSTAEDRSY